jgi:hypothetical protein
MANKPKMYVIKRDASGNAISGNCSTCGRVFQFEDTPEGRRVEKSFETHECRREDVSQAAARIVREATEK